MSSTLSNTASSIKKRLSPAVVCFIAFLINVIAYYPGFLTSDALDQYKQAITGVYGDWHPPAFTLLWRFLNTICRGPFLLLLLQLAALWGSAYLLMRTSQQRYWRLAILVFALAPFVQNFAGSVVKDSQMALSWLLSATILFRSCVVRKGLSVPAAIFTLVLLLYGTLVRINALPGAVPLYFLWACVVFARSRKIIIASAFIIVSIIGVFGNRLLAMCVPVWDTHPQNKLYLHDLAGIFVATGDDVYPPGSYVEPSFDTSYIRQKYHPATYDYLFWNNDGKLKVTYPNAEYSAGLQKAWLAAVKKHPGAYLSHRFQSFLYFLKIKNRPGKYYSAFAWIHPNPYGFQLKRGILWYVFMGPVLVQGLMFYMRPWFWLLLCVVLLFRTAAIRQKNLRMAFVLLLSSALLYILPQFFISQTDTEFRYVYWSCIACSLSLIIYLFRHKLPSPSVKQ